MLYCCKKRTASFILSQFIVILYVCNIHIIQKSVSLHTDNKAIINWY